MEVLCYLKPKPLLPFAGRFHVIDFSLSNCINSQISSIAVLADYQSKQMAEYIRNWHSAVGVEGLTTLEPTGGSYAGTADAVYRNLDHLNGYDADTVLVLAGDHVYKMDYRAMLAFREKVKADATVGVVRVPLKQAHRFGTVVVNPEGRIIEFVEKISNPYSTLASMGIYAFRRDFLVECLLEDASETNSSHDFGYVILPKIVEQDRVFSFEFNGYWRDIGTVEAYYQANLDLLKANPILSLERRWPIFTGDDGFQNTTNPEFNINNSLIGPECSIKGNVENSILSGGVRVEKNAIVRNSVVLANTSVGYHIMVDRCIIDEGVRIGRFCCAGLDSGTEAENLEIEVIGRDVTVPDHSAIGYRSKISPQAEATIFSSGAVSLDSTVA